MYTHKTPIKMLCLSWSLTSLHGSHFQLYPWKQKVSLTSISTFLIWSIEMKNFVLLILIQSKRCFLNSLLMKHLAFKVGTCSQVFIYTLPLLSMKWNSRGTVTRTQSYWQQPIALEKFKQACCSPSLQAKWTQWHCLTFPQISSLYSLALKRRNEQGNLHNYHFSLRNQLGQPFPKKKKKSPLWSWKISYCTQN